MEKIELKHLAPYLPYGLEIINIGNNIIRKFTYELEKPSDIKREISIQLLLSTNHINKPILRPLKDLLNKDLDFWIEFSESIEDLQTDYLREAIVNKTSYSMDIRRYEKIHETLFEMHFDVFGLIEKGLAIDINSLPKEDKEL